MFTKQDIKELAAYRSETTPVLSVYLNVDITQLTAEQYRLTLKGLLKYLADQDQAALAELIRTQPIPPESVGRILEVQG